MTRLGLTLHPLDPLLFRDGRPFEAGDFARSGMPTPQTLAGALRTRVLQDLSFDFDRLAENARQVRDIETALKMSGVPDWFLDLRVRGPWLARDGKPCVPLPATIRKDRDGGFQWSRPLRGVVPGWRPPLEGMRPLWRGSGPVDKGDGGWVPIDCIPAALDGSLRDDQVWKDLYDYDERTGIGINPGTLVAEESHIYGVKLLSLAPGVTFYAEVDVPEGAPKELLRTGGTIAWGGEARHARIEAVPPVAWPSTPPDERRAMLLLTTPAIFRNGWIPDRPPAGAKLVAAAVPDPIPVSGWDLARAGPKPLRHAVPAGAVYFYEECPASALKDIDSLCGVAEDVRQGWGLFVYGGWNHA